MIKKNNFSEFRFRTFWQPLIITYTLTFILVVATCILQYNFDIESQGLVFYRVTLDNYYFLILAKVAEALVPTTLTFSLLIMLTSNDKFGERKTGLIVLDVTLAFLGFLLPTMKDVLGFWLLLISVYVLIIITIFSTSSIINSEDNVYRSNRKAEKSDGKFSR